jgi:cysteine-rich repeat protein
MQSLVMQSLVVGIMLGVAGSFSLGCSDDDSSANPCMGIDCGPHGQCVLTQSGSATCACDSGFHAEGLTCVADSGGCGDGLASGQEACDGTDLRGITCTALGFAGGQLGCRDDCTAFDLSGCQSTICGDNIADAGEVCDGTDLKGHSCQSLGFDGGTLGCLGDCTYYDTSQCQTICGDGLAGGTEACDGTDLRGQSCFLLGYYGGQLSCNEDCSYDLSSCATAGRCGDNVWQAAEEVCDGNDLGGQTCESQGFYEGQLACAASCDAYDTSGCFGTCGDGQVNGPEVCDDGADNGTYGHCKDDCSGLGPYCGDGIINGPEVCDGAVLDGNDCTTIGGQFRGGVLGCNNTCDDWDLSGCTYHCDKTVITPIAPLPLDLARIGAGPAVNGEIYLFGGTDDTDHWSTDYHDVVYVYDIAADTYTDLGSVLPYGISMSHLGIVLGDNGKYYMPPSLGTSHNNGWGTHSRVIEFDPAGPSATETAAFPAVRWGSVMANGGNGFIYFFGSYDGSAIMDIHRYDPATDTLTELTETLPNGGQRAAFLASDGDLYLPTGGTPPVMMVFDVASETLTALTTDPLPCDHMGPLWELPQGTLRGLCIDHDTDPDGWGYYTFDLATHQSTYTWLSAWSFPHPVFGDISPGIQVRDPDTGHIFTFGGYDVVPEPSFPNFYPDASTWRIECLGPALCGNGVVEGDESCDDGNTADGDGCSALCQPE